MNEHTLLGARIAAGLLAGLYFAFAVAIMPALRGMDDAAFVDTMKRINLSIVNPIFLLVFLAAPVIAIVVALQGRSPLLFAAAALGVITMLITVTANVPLNDQLARSGNRVDFESRWVMWNMLRTLTGIGSLACLLLSRSPTR